MNWVQMKRGLYACMNIIRLDKPVPVGSVMQFMYSFELIVVKEPHPHWKNSYMIERSVGCLPAHFWTPRGPVAVLGEMGA